jgi:ADP-ribose pyrophosphatase YjhB (NUDIX family)
MKPVGTVRRTAGGIVLRSGTDQVALVKRLKEEGGGYSWPKGGVEEGESLRRAAIREIEEETGIVGKKLRLLLEEGIGPYRRPNGEGMKEITLFLFETEQKKLKPRIDKHPKAAWVPYKKAGGKLHYAEDRAFFEREIRPILEGILAEGR